MAPLVRAQRTLVRPQSKLTLHLGVLVQPYRAAGRSGRKPRPTTALTTGDVARFLEDKYGIMAAFYRVHQADVARAIEGSLEGALESVLMGKAIDPWGGGLQKVDQAFRDFINSKEVENVGIPGTPTRAAIKGINHRLKHPYRKSNPRRPSFRDTGLYVGSFRSWID